MALSNSLVLEVRSATGSDTNGGGFVTGASGTDWSQQTSPQYSVTDGVTAGSTTITSATAAFGTDVVGNLVYVQGGTGSITAGWYQITARNSALSITVDRATGLTTGTGVTLHIGGALATLTQANSIAVADNIIYCKGTQTITSTLTLSQTQANNGAVYAFTIQGYGTTRGDTGQFTLTTATNSIALLTITGSQIILKNLLLSNTAGTRGVGISTGSAAITYDLLLDSCRLTGFSYGLDYGSFSNAAVPVHLHNCEIDNCINDGIRNPSVTFAVNCYFHDNGGSGLNAVGANQEAEGFFADRCTFARNVAGITHTTNTTDKLAIGGFCIGCNFDTNSGNGYIGPGVTFPMSFINCVFYGNGNGINSSNANSVVTGVQYNNAFGSNSTNRLNFPAGSGDLTLTANPWNNPSSGDYTLNNTAGGGAVLKGAAFQSTIM